MNVASIDIGSNSIILLIAEVDIKNKYIKPLVNEYRMPRIGKGLKEGGRIEKSKVELLKKILYEYLSIIKQYNCETILTAGTSALRIAENSSEIIADVNRNLNLHIQIVEKTKEAELSYLSATFPQSKSENTVIDIGGGSTEIIFGRDNKIYFRESFPIGVVYLSERYLKGDPPTKDEIFQLIEHISKVFQDVFKEIPADTKCIAVAGTPTSLAAIKNNCKEYDENIVDGSILTQTDIEEFIKYFSMHSSMDLLKLNPIILSGRQDLILSGTLLLRELTKFLRIKEVTVSTKGIRYGLIYDYVLFNK